MTVARAFAAAQLLLGGPAFPQPPTDRIIAADYWRWEEVDDPQISPDGKRVLYTRRSVDRARDRWTASIWTIDADGSNHRFLAIGNSARWAPDSRRVGLLREDRAGKTQIFLLDIHSPASVRRLTSEPESVSEPVWSPDGLAIAFTRDVGSSPPPTHGFRLPKPGKGEEWAAEPMITTRLDFDLEAIGYVGDRYRQIFVIPAAGGGGRARQLTEGPWNHPGATTIESRYSPGAVRWSADGQELFFSTLREPNAERRWRRGEIYAVHVRTRAIRQVTARGAGAGYSARPLPSPDGRWIAYVGHDATADTYVANKLYVMRPDGTGTKEISAGLDRAPVGMWWSPESSGVYFTAESEGSSRIYFAPLSEGGPLRTLTDGKQYLAAAGMSRTGLIAATATTANDPADVAVVSTGEPARVRILTDVNGDVIAGKRLGSVEEIWYRSSDSLRIQGWLVKPPDFSPAKKYPLILDIHGGPHWMYGIQFDFGYQEHAANGYLVLYTNPRGSVGYGSAFGNAINYEYPAGRDFDDLMAGVDTVIGRGYVDEQRTYVYGCSGGGTLTLWVVGQTSRFAAAAAACPIAEWVSFLGTTDASFWYSFFRKMPWEDPTEYLRRSPLSYVGKVRTPTLLLVGEKDLRTPASQADMYYRALKLCGVPSALMHFRDEWHGTTSRPSNYIRTQLVVRQWFERYTATRLEGRSPCVAAGAP